MNIGDLEGSIINAIKDATKEAFSTMLMTELHADESFVKNEENVACDLISSLHFFNDKYMVKIALFCDAASACHIAGTMLGMEVSEVDVDVKDAMGEIVNMIAGGAKVKLESRMGELHLLTPWIISARNLKIPSRSDRKTGFIIDSQARFSWVMTKFSFDKGTFIVSVLPNEVPQNSADHSDKDINILQQEIANLKKENLTLRAKFKEVNMVV
ncbi:chemotaxis protein [Candidatus Scalindua japonica]|uniref:Chemotaxis protein n=1 Tax=Candidatus Scalindua japonica TaxID=1284222 RepID=A0A286TW13_9BACT|nr:chemotaxis protein CheX [Candidatus Scalindua japonica]GAX60069.1 chemotaxis protein [Candidatus Scalindua japonica]